MWSRSKRRRVLSETGNIKTSRQSSNGKTRNHGIEDGGFGHPQGSERERDAGRGSEVDGVLRDYAAAMEYQVQEDCAGATVEARQLVARNCIAGSGQMDSTRLVQGIQLSLPR